MKTNSARELNANTQRRPRTRFAAGIRRNIYFYLHFMSGIWDRDDGKTTLDDHDEWSVGATFLTIDLLIPKKPLRYSIICLV